MRKMDRIYLDFAATTPIDRRVLDAMLPFFEKDFGNPSSAHYFGQIAEGQLWDARMQLLRLFNASEHEVIFTSGGSESDNLALRGVALAHLNPEKRVKIVISPVEHHAISETARYLHEQQGFVITKLRIDNFGSINLDFLDENIGNDTAIVSIIHANNEIGTINDIEAIASLCHEKGVLLHMDAVQSAAHTVIDLQKSKVDLLSIAAHKFYGPKGVGALIKRKGVDLNPQITGGPQENHLRSGTENVPGIIGMVKALEIVQEDMEKENQRLQELRDHLIDQVSRNVPGSFLTGHPSRRLTNHVSFVFDQVNGNDLMIALDMAGFAVSSGSACKVGNPKPSSVLLALGIDPTLAMGSLRVSMGRTTTIKDVDSLIAVLPHLVGNLRRTAKD